MPELANFGVARAWRLKRRLEAGGVVREGAGRYGVPTPRTGRRKFPVVQVACVAGDLDRWLFVAEVIGCRRSSSKVSLGMGGEGVNSASVGSPLVQRAST